MSQLSLKLNPHQRSSVEFRSSALAHMFCDLDDLKKSVKDSILPEFISVIKPKASVLLIDPSIFVDNLPEVGQKEENSNVTRLLRLKARFSTQPSKRKEAGSVSPVGVGTRNAGRRSPWKGMLEAQCNTEGKKKEKDNSASAKVLERLRQDALARRSSLSRILQATNSLEKYKPAAVRQQIKAQALISDFHSQVIRLTRSEIYEMRRNKHMEVLQDKLRRYDWRQRADEISQGKKLWVSVLFYLSSLKVFIEKQTKRKELHRRSEGILKFLLMMTISVGKIVSIVKRKRYRKAFAIIHRIAPYLNKWRKRHQNRKRERIAEFIENSLSQDVFYKIIVSWKTKILAIQRLIKTWLLRRKAHKLLLCLCWNKLEVVLATKTTKPMDVPPKAVKLLLISDLLKSKMKEHLIDLENWRAKCETILEKHEKLKYELIEAPIPPPKLPLKPAFPTFLNKTEIMSLMSQAEKKKSRWTRMSKEKKQANAGKRNSFTDTSIEET